MAKRKINPAMASAVAYERLAVKAGLRGDWMQAKAFQIRAKNLRRQAEAMKKRSQGRKVKK